MKFSIFYHLYLVGDWQRIFIDHLYQLNKAGCLRACHSTNIGITYLRVKELNTFLENFSDYFQFRVIFTRRAASRLRRKVSKDPLMRRLCGSKKYVLPCKLKNGSYARTNMEYGVSETILYMTQMAHEMKDVDQFFFLHSTGVTIPSGYEKPNVGKYLELLRLCQYIDSPD